MHRDVIRLLSPNIYSHRFLYVRIYGERRKLFINRGRENVVGIIAKGKRKHGYIFSDWSHIEKINPAVLHLFDDFIL